MPATFIDQPDMNLDPDAINVSDPNKQAWERTLRMQAFNGLLPDPSTGGASGAPAPSAPPAGLTQTDGTIDLSDHPQAAPYGQGGFDPGFKIAGMSPRHLTTKAFDQIYSQMHPGQPLPTGMQQYQQAPMRASFGGHSYVDNTEPEIPADVARQMNVDASQADDRQRQAALAKQALDAQLNIIRAPYEAQGLLWDKEHPKELQDIAIANARADLEAKLRQAALEAHMKDINPATGMSYGDEATNRSAITTGLVGNLKPGDPNAPAIVKNVLPLLGASPALTSAAQTAFQPTPTQIAAQQQTKLGLADAQVQSFTKTPDYRNAILQLTHNSHLLGLGRADYANPAVYQRVLNTLRAKAKARGADPDAVQAQLEADLRTQGYSAVPNMEGAQP